MISTLREEDGSEKHGPENLKRIVKNFYKKLYQKREILIEILKTFNTIKFDDQKKILNESISEILEEIKNQKKGKNQEQMDFHCNTLESTTTLF